MSRRPVHGAVSVVPALGGLFATAREPERVARDVRDGQAARG